MDLNETAAMVMAANNPARIAANINTAADGR